MTESGDNLLSGETGHSDTEVGRPCPCPSFGHSRQQYQAIETGVKMVQGFQGPLITGEGIEMVVEDCEQDGAKQVDVLCQSGKSLIDNGLDE